MVFQLHLTGEYRETHKQTGGQTLRLIDSAGQEAGWGKNKDILNSNYSSSIFNRPGVAGAVLSINRLVIN